MTEQEFTTWLRQAKPKDKCVYYSGASLTDTLVSNELRKVVWSHACRGYCYLVQKRHRAHNYDFIVIKASSPPLESLVPLFEMKNNSNVRRYTLNKERGKNKPEPLEVSQHG